ncbi:MAG: NAD(P)H-dependent oxidoreductase [Clostridia bacterium]|nr:NAD(P)H-dependent oxidoreductase [Clostridia bacterium]
MHEPISILAVVGGISTKSVNRTLYGFLEREAPAGMILATFPIETLPFFSQDLEDAPPESVFRLKEAIDRADGVLFVTPEYNRSFPGVLKNAIDWGSRPWMQNSWEGKPAASLGASIGAIGTYGAQSHLKTVMAFLDMVVMHHPEFYFNITRGVDEDGDLTPSARALVRDFLASFEDFVREHNNA